MIGATIRFVVTPVVVALVAATALALVAQRDDEPASVEREWRVRHFALHPEETSAEWLAAARSADWVERWSALDALLRAARTGALQASDGAARDLARELARRALADRNPGLAALGAELLLELGAAGDASRDAVEALARSPLAEARIAAAGLCGSRTDAIDPLAVLVSDSDDDVRAAAARALVGALHALAEESDEFATAVSALARFVRRTHNEGGDGAVVDWCGALATAPPRHARALADALELADAPLPAAIARAAAAAAGDPVEPVAFVDDWCRAREWVPRRDELFALAAKRLGAEVCRELVRAADLAGAAYDGAPTGPGTQRGTAREEALLALAHGAGDTRSYPLAGVLLRAALDAGGGRVFLAHILEGGDALVTHALTTLGPDLTGWTRELAEAHLERGEDAGRLAIVYDALVHAARSGDAGAIDALVRLLENGGEAARVAYRGLGRSSASESAHPALRKYWLALHGDNAIAALSTLPRAAFDRAVRQRLLELGRDFVESRGAIARALGAFVGDQEVAWYLDRWLIEFLAELDAVGDARSRDAFDRAGDLLPALAEVGGEGAIEGLVGALDWAIGRSPSVGRIAVREIGRTSAGRARLADYADQHLDRRMRTELALALCSSAADPTEWVGRESELVELLMADGTEGRIDDSTARLDALARLGTTAAIAALVHYTDVSVGSTSFATAAALALGASDVAPARLDALARSTRAFEVRRALLFALERRGGAAELEELRKDWLVLAAAHTRVDAGWADVDWPRRELGVDLALPGHPEEFDALELEMRAALVRLGAGPPGWRAALFELPRDEAVATLLDRFADRTRTDPAFRWSDELELARVLARRGELRTLLETQPLWWRFDGRLVLELARIGAASGDGAAHDLVRGAIAALLGEGVGATGELLDARALAAELCWRSQRFDEAAVHYGALADPFAARPLGRGDSAARPVPGANHATRIELLRRAAWSRALAAAERGEAAPARADLDRAGALVWGDEAALVRQRDVEAAVRTKLGESR